MLTNSYSLLRYMYGSALIESSTSSLPFVLNLSCHFSQCIYYTFDKIITTDSPKSDFTGINVKCLPILCRHYAQCFAILLY